MTMMTQCRMIRIRDGAIDTAFIDSSLAHEGRIVDIRIDGVWDRGWRIENAGSQLPAEVVRERERDYRHHRRATDTIGRRT